MNTQELVQSQHVFFESGKTRSIEFRKTQLKKLFASISAHEQDILNALKLDLNKSPFEAYSTEIGIVREEISFILKHLDSWAKPKRVKTPLVHFPSKSTIYHDPYGVCLIMSPWNYPFQLAMAPLAAAIAGGNCTVLKPSNYSPAVSAVINTIISECFPGEYVSTVLGGRDANTALLEQKYDYIFFTGGVTVGKLVMEAASKNLTPLSLELGGKSPCIINEDADVDLAAKRLVFGKFMNAGQTCIAPDYVLAHKNIQDELVQSLKKYIVQFYGPSADGISLNTFSGQSAPANQAPLAEHSSSEAIPFENGSFPKIITQKHFDRLSAFVDGSDSSNGKLEIGGKRNAQTQQISPSVLTGVKPNSPVMSEEIFGPILPIITVSSIEEAASFVRSRPHPLALYLFTNSKSVQSYITGSLRYGGGCINDTIVHVASSYMPFGGVGNSGMGQYHGKSGFDTFTRQKSVLKKSNRLDINLRYPPFGDGTETKFKLLKMFM